MARRPGHMMGVLLHFGFRGLTNRFTNDRAMRQLAQMISNIDMALLILNDGRFTYWKKATGDLLPGSRTQLSHFNGVGLDTALFGDSNRIEKHI
jgi:hypothetical protein